MTRTGKETSLERIAREVERERAERSLHDEARAGVAPLQDFHTKDARQSVDSGNLKRQKGS